MGLMCNVCYSGFRSALAQRDDMCHLDSCVGSLVEIDNDFLDVIIILNRLGFTTDFCCAGHVRENVGSYILFNISNSIEYNTLSNTQKKRVNINDLSLLPKWSKLIEIARKVGLSIEVEKYFDNIRLIMRSPHVSIGEAPLVHSYNVIFRERTMFYELIDESTRIFKSN